MTKMPEKKFKVLEVDLTTEKVQTVDVTEDVQNFIGGRSLGAKLLWDHVPPMADPMGEENILYVGIGPITGLMGAVINVSAKSPLTFLRGQSNLNGHFGVELTYTEYNAGIIVKGKAKKPVYLFIYNDKVEIRDASSVWGKSGVETQQTLKNAIQEETGEPNFRFLSIGPAGENLVRNADICHDVYHHAARLGMGTVMGSKLLKAIAVKGTKDPGYVDPQTIFKMMQKVYQDTRMYRAVHRRWGHTTSMAQRYYKTREGVKNKQAGWDEICDLYNPIELEQGIKVWSDSCHGCFVGCKVPYFHRHTEVGPCAGELRHDNAGGWSANAMIPGYDKQSYLCAYVDYLGLDSEDVSAVVTWVMECYDRGLFRQEDLDGIDLTWGNLQAICALLKKIAFREGIGELLAEGLKIAPEKLGKEFRPYAMTHKGTAISSYELRGSMKEALDLAVTPVGELHGGRGTPLRVAYDSLTTCSFLRRELARIFDGVEGWAIPMLNAASGWELRPDTWEKMMLRAATMERCYSLREGYRPERDDLVPDRFFDETIYDKYGEPKVLDREDFLKLRRRRYREYGLKDDGIPSKDLLEDLGLDFTISELKKEIDL
jgi:aldehyde:ferredoxin oxidoreductase